MRYVILAVLAATFIQPATGQVTDAQIAALIVQTSRDDYHRTGHPCACPDDLMRNGHHCGRVSAYIRPGGASPRCFPSDVTKSEIDRYRAMLKIR